MTSFRAGVAAGVLWSLSVASVVRAAGTPAARPVALYISGCPHVNEPGVRRLVAVELGERLVAIGSPAPANVDRLLVGCHGQVARLEAGDPAGPRYAERTLVLGQFPGDAGTRALALAALELLAALDRPRAPAAPAPAPTPPPVTTPAPTPASADAYQQQFVWFNDIVVTGWGYRKWVPYRGKYHEPLRGSDFYNAVERPDLATRYRVWRAVDISLIVGGAAAVLYGLSRFHSDSGLGFGLWLGGGVAINIGVFSNPDPIDESEARRLADEHNKRLKHQLGLAF